jgi:hypothetical protein
MTGPVRVGPSGPGGLTCAILVSCLLLIDKARAKDKTRSCLLFIIRVKRELKRVYKNGCRYNERLNAETGGSKTPRLHWVARINIQQA